MRRKYWIGHPKGVADSLAPGRMVQDNHTPQVLKLQIVLIGALIGVLPVALAGMILAPAQLGMGCGGGAVADLSGHNPTLCAQVGTTFTNAGIVGPGNVIGTGNCVG